MRSHQKLDEEIIVEQETAANRQLARWMGGIAMGAVAMYLADPVQGKRRRAKTQAKFLSLAHHGTEALYLAARDAGNRLSGLQARVNHFLRQDQAKPIDDHVLEARVRSKLGRNVSHPHAIQVIAQQGRITLNGLILAEEKEPLLALVRDIPGVIDLRERLEAHQQPDHVPGLQGEGPRAVRRAARRQNWTPSRTLATVGCGLLGYYGMQRRSPFGLLLALGGMGLIARSLRHSTGMHEVHMRTLEKTIDLKAPPEMAPDAGKQGLASGQTLH
jgi:hypothetical protein